MVGIPDIIDYNCFNEIRVMINIPTPHASYNEMELLYHCYCTWWDMFLDDYKEDGGLKSPRRIPRRMR